MAVYPVAPGHPDYSSNEATKYIPAVYSALLIKKFYPMCVFSKISNTNYEGDIKDSGDTVFIRTRPTIETFPYKKGMVLPVQNPESPYVTLRIDQGEGFSFAIDKVDEFQSDINLMNTWADDAAEQMKQVLDRNVLTTIAGAASTALSGAPATNIGGYTGSGPTLDEFTIAKGALVNGAVTSKGTTVVLGTDTAPSSLDTGDEITDRVLKYGRYLDENNAPEDGRFVVMPTWMGSILKSMASNNFGLAYATGQNSANLLAGSIPKIDRFELIFTNNMPLSMNSTIGNEDASPIFFGTKYATTFATQITESRIIDNPFSFGKMMQGLQVYGFNIIKPPLIGVDFGKNA
jgi:hypothetical protein